MTWLGFWVRLGLMLFIGILTVTIPDQHFWVVFLMSATVGFFSPTRDWEGWDK